MHVKHIKKSFLFVGLTLLGIIGTFFLESRVRANQAAPIQIPPTSVSSLDPKPLRELYTQPNDKYLYTASWSEFTAAQNSYGLKSAANRPLGYIFTKKTIDTQPVYRLKKISTGSWLYTASAQEKSLLVDEYKTFTSEGVAGYLLTTQKPGTEKLNRYTNGKGWRLAFESQELTKTNPEYRLDGPLGYTVREHYKVGAYYFGMFNYEGSTNIRAGTRAVYGRDDWWGGVKDFYGQEYDISQNTRGWSGDFSNLKPSIGYYDNSQPAVLEKHINQATAGGLDYFNFYYYWNNIENRPTIDGGLKAFLAASNRNKMQFTISPCFHQYGTNNKLGMDRADFPLVANIMSDIVAEPNFLKTQSGRPLMFMCDVRGIDNNNVQSINEFIAILKQTVKDKTGSNLFVMQHSEYDGSYLSQLRSDGVTCLNHGRSISSGSYQSYVRDIAPYFARFDAQQPTLRCITTDFNEMTRTDIAVPKSAVRYYTDRTHALYRQALQQTKSSMQVSPSSEIDNYAVSFAFNEWHEGAVLESNVRDGSLNLRELQNVFRLPRR